MLSKMLSKEDVTDILRASFDEESFKEYMEQSEGVINTLLDLMGLPSGAKINNIDFKPELFYRIIDKRLDDIDYAKKRGKCGIGVWDMDKKELDFDPYYWINNTNCEEDIELILGEYLPSTQEIILYYNAIINCVAPIIYDILEKQYGNETDLYDYKLRDNIINTCKRYLVVAFRIVYAHEYFHAVHHQKGNLKNADIFLAESLAQYFELLYCGICPCVQFADKFAKQNRNWLKKCPNFYDYKGALTFDKLLGEQVSNAVKKVFFKFNHNDRLQHFRNNIDIQQELRCITPVFLKDCIPPRYEMFRELFSFSKFRGEQFIDIHSHYYHV